MNYSIYAESTPNPEVMKFVSNRMLADKSIEINSIQETQGITIAEELMKFPFIKSLYISSNFISIAKKDTIEWEDIAMQLRIFITDHLNSEGIKNYTEHISEETETSNKKDDTNEKTVIIKEYSDNEKEVIAILDEYIKPAVESDGGAITLHSYVDNIVSVDLKGACSGCPSATSTLKGGIESLLKQKINPDIVVVANEQ
jgi:Fe-S cluster biogenesis protein NfuA